MDEASASAQGATAASEASKGKAVGEEKSPGRGSGKGGSKTRAEKEAALLGLSINIADQTVYPQSDALHDMVVNMVARLWHCPSPGVRFHLLAHIVALLLTFNRIKCRIVHLLPHKVAHLPHLYLIKWRFSHLFTS